MERFGFTEYKLRHVAIFCKQIHYRILESKGRTPQEPWCQIKPHTVVALEEGALYWDKKWHSCGVEHNKPDIVWERTEDVLMVEIGCPNAKDVVEKEECKYEQYKPLKEEFQILYRNKTVESPP